MCRAVEELQNKASQKTVCSLVKKSKLAIEDAAEELKISVDEMRAIMSEFEN